MKAILNFYNKSEERMNVISHAIGLGLGIIALPFLITYASIYGDVRHIVSFSIFGASVIVLYAASTLYHSAKQEKTRFKLKVFDHAAIYVLIAGTYTPFSLVTLSDSSGWLYMIIAWSLAISGIIFKLFFTGRYSLLSTMFYVLMGGIMIFSGETLLTKLPGHGFLWLTIGGISYLVGAIFYSIKKIPYNHAIFHFFVLFGSISHFVSIFFYVLPSN